MYCIYLAPRILIGLAGQLSLRTRNLLGKIPKLGVDSFSPCIHLSKPNIKVIKMKIYTFQLGPYSIQLLAHILQHRPQIMIIRWLLLWTGLLLIAGRTVWYGAGCGALGCG